MKNLERAIKKNCLFMDHYDFTKMVYQLTGWEIECSAEYGVEMDAEECDEVFDGDIAEFERELKEVLSEQFRVEVTSIHTDNCEDCLGVWIVYVNERVRERCPDR